jgi:general secretion pathway protein A
MYERFFGLREKPFEITPDTDFFFSSEIHKEGLAILEYAVLEGKSFTVVTGEVGSGKTMLIHYLLNKLNGSVRISYIFNPIMDPKEFLDFICTDFGIAENAEAANTSSLTILHNFLLDCYKKNEKVFLIVDEAQALDTRILQMIRMLTNFETSKSKLLNVMLIGQPELNLTLNSKIMRPLRQRIALRYHIHPLNSTETSEYISYRIKKAGGRNINIFDKSAVHEIYRYSKGIPRLINILCDNALVTGFSAGVKSIDKNIIKTIIHDLEGTPEKKNREEAVNLILLFILVGFSILCLFIVLAMMYHMLHDTLLGSLFWGHTYG